MLGLSEPDVERARRRGTIGDIPAIGTEIPRLDEGQFVAWIVPLQQIANIIQPVGLSVVGQFASHGCRPSNMGASRKNHFERWIAI